MKGKKITIREKWAKIFAGELGNEPESQIMWILNSYREQFAISFLDLFYMLKWEKNNFLNLFLANLSHASAESQ